MKSILLFAGLLIVASVKADQSVCPAYPPGTVRCMVDPCFANNCAATETCCQDYSVGCNFHCVSKSPEPEPELKPVEESVCPAYLPGPVRCIVDPCFSNNCAATETCCQDYSVGCHFHCVSKTPEPEPELKPVEESVCPAYPPGTVRCMVDPCLSNNCAATETCCQDYSEGCNFHCVPTKQEPAPEPFQCPNLGELKANCLINPCRVNTCESHETCCADYSTGCNFQCFPTIPEPDC